MNRRQAESPLDILRRYWGHDGFRPMQSEIIESVLSGADTLGLLPTGGGKSVTFQVPAMLMPGITVVVTPLISLMKDQVDNLRAIGIGAVCLHSGMTRGEHTLAMQKAEAGRARLMYVSPEKLCGERFVQSLKGLDVSLIVVDEAHCISQWGYDFRPSYLKISGLRDLFPSAPVLALTASATPQVVDDIMDRLGFRVRESAVFRRSFFRPEISYIVRYGDNKPERLLRVMRGTGGSAVVYVRSRKRTREIAAVLQAEGISAEAYHAGLAPEEKTLRQQLWKDGAVRVMVATNAFGMGIDKPDVRAVVHYDLPSSLEEYYQEAGRAGRDGLPAFAVVLAAPADKAVLARRLADAFPPKEFIAEVYDRACVFVDLCMGEGCNQVFDFDFERFCAVHSLRRSTVRSALRLLSQAGYVEFMEDADARARVIVRADKRELYDLRLSDDEDAVLQYLLRNCSGIFADYVQISETVIASRLGMTADRVYHALLGLGRTRALHYVPRRENPCLYFPSRRVQARHVELPVAVYEDMRRRMDERIRAMRSFVFDGGECRANRILRYFGEEPESVCGSCDVCRSSAAAGGGVHADSGRIAAMRRGILHVCSRPDGASLADIIAEVSAVSDTEIVAEVRRMADDNELTITDNCRIKICRHH